MRLATIATPDGPRLHVRARSGYVDAAEATGDPRLSSLQYVLEAGLSAMDALRPLQDSDGSPVSEADFAPAGVPGGKPGWLLPVVVGLLALVVGGAVTLAVMMH